MTERSFQNALRSLPSVEEILQTLQNNTSLPQSVQDLPHAIKTDVIRKVIDHYRKAILNHQIDHTSSESILATTIDQLELQARPSLRRAINATGIIIHTNLGRSALPDEAIQSVIDVAKGYSTLEYDTQTMERGSRHDHYEELICALTGAEAAIAVNNNAAAVMMVLHEFAHDKQAIISRGELIEIGGSFRIPDIMNFSHAHMIEVGTTNKTHLEDYARAITDETAMLLKVHTSNYRLIGFTETVEAKDLKKLADKINKQRAKKHDTLKQTNPQETQHALNSSNKQEALPLMVYEDLGSGLFIRPKWITYEEEPTVAEAFAQGCDLISFSGDKLLGGPQAGIIIGKKLLIDRLKKNPLARALRLDKMTIAALETTLRLYLDPKKTIASIPTLNMLCTNPEEIKDRAQRLKSMLENSSASKVATFQVTRETARAGGGSLPMFDIPSYGVEVSFSSSSKTANIDTENNPKENNHGSIQIEKEAKENHDADAQNCMQYLIQKHPIPIIGRINHQKLIFDTRTLLHDTELEEIVKAFCSYVKTIAK